MQISFDGYYANYFQKFLCKAKHYQNLRAKNGTKQRFSLLTKRVVIQAVCTPEDLEVEQWIYRRSQKLSTAITDQYFLS